MIEHVLVGAVGVYLEDWPPAARLDGGAIVAPSDPALWFEAMAEGVRDPIRLRDLFERARRTLPALNDPVRQRAVWRLLLDIPA